MCVLTQFFVATCVFRQAVCVFGKHLHRKETVFKQNSSGDKCASGEPVAKNMPVANTLVANKLLVAN